MPDDFAADLGTSGSVSAGGSATGNIETSFDRDWFAAILQAGRSYEISLEGSPTGGGTLDDTYLDGIYTSAGSYIFGTSDDDSGDGFNSFLEFTATNGGVHYISAAAFGAQTGSYTLSLVALGGSGDDYSDNTGTSGRVSDGGSTMGEIESAYDTDWFALSVTAGTTYLIDLEGAGTLAGSLSDPYLYGIYSSSGLPIAGTSNDDGGVGLNSSLEFTPSTSGTIYIAAGAYGANIGTYTLSVEGLGSTDDYSEDSERAGSVAVGGAATGEIEDAYDGDWFAVSLMAGRTYMIDLEGTQTGEGTLSDPFILGVFDNSESLIPASFDDDGGEGLNSQLEFTATVSGTHYVSAGAYGANTGTYRLSVSDAGTGDDYADNPGTTGAVSPGSDATGAIEDAYDRDWFAITLEGGRSYQIDLEGSGTGGGSLSDPYLNGVFNSAGSFIAGSFDDDGGEGLNSRVEFTPVSDGTYFISAGAYGANIGSYTLSVSGAGSSDDYAADTSTTGAVGASGIATGEIEAPEDRDWFAVTLERGATYAIGLEGSWSEGGTLSDPFLRGIYTASGTPISGTSDDDGGVVLDSLLEFTATSTGTHYISAGAFGDATGTYTLVVENLGGGGDDFASDTGTSGAVSVGGAATGEIEEADDTDWFAVTLASGGSYVFDLEGTPTGAGTLPDPYIEGVYDSAGSFIAGAYDDDGGLGLNSRLEFVASSGGTYYIAAGAFGLNTGTYTLSVTGVGGGTDDYADSTSTDGTVAVGGSSTGVIEEDGDRDWFAVTLQAGRSYQFDLEGAQTSAGTLSDPYIRGLYDSAGDRISNTTDDDGGDGLNSQMSYSAAATGTYYISAGAYGLNTGSYKVSVTDTGAADDYSQDTSTTGAVPVNGAATGVIESAGDRDWFEVSLTSGSTYLIDLEGVQTGGGTLSDPYFRGIYDASGVLIGGTADDDGGAGLNSQLLYTAASGGTHYLSAGAYAGYSGSYKISIEEIATAAPTDDYAQTTATTGAVAVGGSSSGAIEETGDQDWFAVSMEAGQTYRIDVEGSETAAGTLADPYLRGIHNSSGSLIAGSTNDDGGAGLNSQLEFTASSAGTYYIAAGAYDGTGSYKVTVSEVAGAPGGGDFDITIAYEGDPAYNSVFEAAAATWESIITDDLPDVVDANIGAVDDLRIEASVTAIDGAGGILGQAGPRAFREGSSLPYAGMMQFDSADLAGMAAKGILQDVIEHEMGHVLGLGTLWSWLGLKSGFSYTGANAVAEYATLTGTTQSTVPLETTGGPGTAGSHWSEAIFTNELMTGYAENSPPMPLSRLTVGGLEDLGYAVDYGAAEAYTLAGSSLSAEDLILSVVSAEADGRLSDIGGTSALTADAFSGARVINFEDKPLNVAATPAGEKLDGTVTTADEDTVFFFETTTGNDYFVEIIGTFEKNEPATADDVKGTITSMSFYSEGFLLVTYDFSDAPVDAEEFLGSWRPYDLSGNNYIENRSPNAQNDVIDAGGGDDVLVGGLGDDDLDGGAGDDAAVFDVDYADVAVSLDGDVFTLVSDLGTDTVTGIETFEFADRTLTAAELEADADGGGTPGLTLVGTPGDDRLEGGEGDDTIRGLGGDDRLIGNGGNDRLEGGDGLDILNGGDGDDTILGGASSADRRDQIFGGAGDDNIDAGYGNDAAFGGDGNDTIAGGFGADELQGQAGNDVITGSALSDLVFGGDGNDFVNGGFGFDRINGGDGADKFYHLGIRDHGSDWVQDYTAADGDVLLFGDATASADDFNVQFTHTSSPETGRSGDDDVQEAFVIYRPAGLIVWALVDGAGEASLNIEIGGEVFDLLA
ncbi:Ca2+-binding RTX toxin-like protein [Rhodovulum iodosum]|uniref:Ca2+-binding RTX toxin-like protein n=1 Tax=Rhodovulum iodosum TaxID=68291 RepID=A0ABV3XS48_9RHOB|nr:pre-peptidase C-terminal domain-containing protein [Rhodovulum robiginosum]RSK30471.1 hypothetical protein EJA01_16980 [Rhodovulum robiginosum]